MANSTSSTPVVPAYSIIVEDVRTMFGKRSGQKRAQLTGRYGSTVAEATDISASGAKSALLEKLADLCEQPRPSYVFCGDGETVLVVFKTLDGWEYDIVSSKRTMASGCCMSGPRTRKEAVQRAIEHADQSFGGTLNVIRGN